MKRVDIISKGTHKILESREDSNFVLSENSVVIINTPIKAIKKIERIGNDLVIHFSKTDEPLIIKNYYNDNNNADNSLVLKTEDGRLLWIQDLENAGVIDKAINYQVIDDVELLLYQEDSPYMAALPWLTGGILIAALAYGNREKNGAPKEDKPIFKDPVVINAYEDNVGSKTGTFGILKPTDDTTPGFVIGTLEDDRTPVLYVDGKEVASVYDRENGILTPVEPLSEGSHLIAYKEVDGKGNEGDLGEAAEIIIDTTAPNQPDTPTEYIDDAGEKTGHFDFTVSTDDTTPTIVIGDIPADETPTLYVDGRPVESIYDAENGTLTPKTPLSEGTHEISFTLTDEAGNESFQSDPVTIDIVTTAPNQPATPTSYIDDIGNNQGQFNFSVPTDDTKPGIVIGVLDNGITPNLYVDGKEVAAIYDPATGTLTPTVALAEGTHSITYTLTDVAGNGSVPSNPVVIVIDTTAPSVLQLDQVYDSELNIVDVLNSGDYTNDTKPTLSGHGAEANAIITLKDETGKVLNSTTADDKGNWSIEPTEANKLNDGAHTLNVTQTDKAGNESPATSFDLIIDTTMPKQATKITEIWDDVAPKQDVVIDNNGYTNDTSPTLKGTISEALQANEFVAIYRNGELIARLKATDLAGSTDWSYTDTKNLEDGKDYQYLARVEDLAGNEGGDSNKYTIKIDISVPKQIVSIESMTDNVGSSTGDFKSGAETDDSEPTLNGSLNQALAENEVIAIYRNGERVGEVKLSEGVVKWSYTDRGLSDKTTYHYTARVEDASGQQGPESNTFDLILNTGGSLNTAVIDGIWDDVAPQVGDITQFGNNGYINDTSPLLKGSVIIKDSQAKGEKVAIYCNEVKIAEVDIDPVSHTWSYQAKDLQDGKEYKYSVAVLSEAGNAGAKSVETVIHIDTTKPPQVVTIETIYDDKLPIVDNISNGGTTNDSTPELKGTLTQVLGEGEELVIYRNGVELKLSSGSLIIDGTKWSYTDSSLEDQKSYTYTALVRDKAGNVSDLSNPYTINTQFSIGPNPVQIIRIIDDVEPKTTNKIDPNGGSTNDTTPTLEGSLDKALSAGEVLVICRNGDEINSFTVSSGSTSWRYEDKLSVDGTYVYTAFIRDAAGNKGTISSEYKIVLDTVAPKATAQIDSYTDDTPEVVGTFLSGTSTNDTSPTLNISVMGTVAGDEHVAVYLGSEKVGIATLIKDNFYQFTPTGLVDGKTYQYTVRIEDAAGNQGKESAEFSLTIDTTAPSVLKLDQVYDSELNIVDVLNSGDYTNDTKPTLSGHGAEANAIITLKDETGKVLNSTTADDKGNWSIEPTEANKLSDGPHTLNVTQTDKAGNESPATSFDLIIDTTMPKQATEITGILDDVAPLVGDITQFDNNGYTNDTTPTLKGTISDVLQANEFVAIYRDGELIARLKATDLAGSTDWSYTDTKNMEDGKDYQYLARVEDLAGNEGGDSNKYTIKIDVSVPKQIVSIESMTDNVGSSTGDFKSGAETDDSEPTLNGSLNQALAENEVIAIYRNGERVGEVKLSEGVVKWSYTDRGLSDKTTYHYTARVEDDSGQQGPESNTFDLILNTGGSINTAVIDGIWDDVAPQVGDITQFGNNGYTNDTSPLLKGSVIIKDSQAKGEKVAIYCNEVKIAEVDIDPVSHTWSYQAKDLQDGQVYKYSVAVLSEAGNAGAKSVETVIHIDTTKPPQVVTIETIYDDKLPIVDNIENGGKTNDSTPELKGTLTQVLGAGEELVIYRNGVELKLSSGSLIIDGTKWSYTDSSLEDQKSYTYTALVRDKAGNVSDLSNPYTINTQFSIGPNPVQIIRIIDDVEPKTTNKIDPNGGSTNDKTPTLEGSLDKALSAGEVLVICRNGDEINSFTVSSGSTSWRYEDKLSVDGEYTYTAFIRDAAGNKGTISSEYKIVLDTVAPTATAQIDSYTDDAPEVVGTFLSGTSTNDTSPTLNISVMGTVAGDEYVAVYLGSEKVGIATLIKDNFYQLTLTGLVDGKTYQYTVRIEDAAGNQGKESAEFSLTIDTTAPSVLQLDQVYDSELNIVDVLNSGDYTNDTKPTLSGHGAEANAIITLKDETGKVLNSTTADDKGNWSIEPTEANKLSDGPHTLNVTQTDKAGNESPATSFDLIIDTTMPKQATEITGILDDVAPLVGDITQFDNNGYTNDTTPTLKGTISDVLQANEFVAIYRDGELIARLKATDLAGSTDWSYTDTKNMEDGKDYQYLARVEDLAGNEGGDSNKYTIKIDISVPKQIVSIESMTDNVGSSTGDFKSGAETDDSEPTLNGSLNQALAENEVIAIYRNGERVGEVKLSEGVVKWSYTDRGLSDKTTYHYTARVEDASGQQGPESNTFDLILNTGGSINTAVIDGIWDDVAPQVGDITQFGNNGYTNDTSPLLKGSVIIKDSQAKGEKVAIYCNEVKIAEVDIDPVSHTWSYQAKDLQDGQVYKYSVAVLSEAGNAGAKSVETVIHIDTTKPPQVVTIETIYDDKLPIVDNIENGGKTNDSTPELKGTLTQVLGAGEELVIYRNGVELKLSSGSLIIDGTKWSYTDSSLEDQKSYTYTALVRDKAGNVSDLSNPYTINTQFSIGPNPVQIIRIIDDVEPKTTNKIDPNGGSTNDTTPTLEGSLDKALSAGEVLVICRNGDEINSFTVSNGSTSWRYEDELSVDGTYVYTAFIRDAAGNKGTISSEYKIVLDTVPPTATAQIYSYTDDVAPQLGDYGSGTYTNDTTPTLNISIKGVLDINEVVAVYRDGAKVGEAILVNGIYRFEDKALADGKTYTYTVRVEDAAGNQGIVSDQFIINIDTTPPLKPISAITQYDDVGAKVGILPISTPTDDTKPGFVIDKLASDQQAYLYVDNVKVDAIYDPVKGTLTPVTELATGDHVIQYSVVDSAGNEGQKSDPATIQIALSNTITPATPTQYIDDVDPVQGIFGTGTTTNDTTPSVIITPISSDEKATLYVGGKEVESVYDPVKGTLTPKMPLQDGDYKVTYTVTDIVGNESPQSGPINIIVDTVVPAVPTTPTQYLDNVDPVQGLFGTGTSTNDQTPGIMIGQKDSDLTATLYVDGKAVESIYDATSGTLTPKTPLVDGNYNFSYSLTDTAGNESPQSGTINITIDTTAPLKPISAITQYDDDVGAKVGILPISTPTDDTKPGFVIDKLASDQQAYLYVDNVKVDAIYDPVKGTLTPVKELTTGDHVIQYSVVDNAGNEGQKSDPATIQIALSNTNTPATPTQYIDDVDPVQGIFGTGTTTNDTTPSVVITPISSDEKATLYVGGKEVESVYDPVKGTLTPKTPLQDGDYKVTYTVTDIVGNESPQSGPINIIVDTVVPVAPKTPTQYLDDVDPVQGLFGTGTSTNDQTPGIMIGQKDSDLTATLYVDGKAVESVYDAASGTLTPKTPLVDGNYNFSYSLTDKAGNESAQSGAINITIDTIAPAQPDSPTQYIDDVNPQTGIFENDSSTNDTRPGFIIGELKEDETPTLYVDGKPVDAIYDPVAGTLTPKDPLSEGSHDITYSVTDAAGNESLQSNPDQPMTVVIDTIAPAPLTIESYTDNYGYDDAYGLKYDVGTFPIDKPTNDRTPTLNGSGAEAGVLITLKDETGKILGTSIADVKGNWSVTPTIGNQLDQGEYQKTLFVTETDAAGNESTPSPCVLTIDTVGPSNESVITKITDDSNKDIGISGTTKDTTPTLVGTLSEPLSATDKVLVFREKTLIGTAVMTSSTTWEFTDTTIDISKYVGTQTEFNYQVRVEDNAANRSGYSRIYSITIDFRVTTKTLILNEAITENDSSNHELTTTVGNTSDNAEQISNVNPLNFMRTFKLGIDMPNSDARSLQIVTITEIYDYKEPIIDVVPNGGTTNADEPEINGKLSQPLAEGEKVYIYCNGQVVGVAKVDGTDWTYTDGSLGNHKTYTYQAIVKDSQGNTVSDFSNSYSLVTDFDVISQGTSITRIIGETEVGVQDVVKNNGSTNDTKPTLQGTINTELQTGDEIVIYRDGIEIGTAKVTGNTWSFEDDLSLEPQGNHSYTAAIRSDGVDGAKSAAYNIVYDTIAPIVKADIESYIDNTSPQIGVFYNNSFTNDVSPVLNIKLDGTISSDESVYVYRDGQYIGKATLVDGLNYQFSDNNLEDGKTYTYTTLVVDAAGNKGQMSDDFNITVDLVAPDQPNAPTHYYDDVGSIQGVFGTDTTTDDTKPAIIIEQIESNESATLYVDGVKVDSVYDPVSSTLTPVIPLENGKYDISYTISDAAGNESYKSDVIVITVNTTAPTQPTAPTEFVDNVDPVQGTFASGTTTNDTTPSVIVGTLPADEKPTLYVDGDKLDSIYDPVAGTLTPVTPLAEGDHDLSYTLTDIAGNESLPSDPIQVIVDVTAPAKPTTPTEFVDDAGSKQGDFPTGTTTDDTTPSVIVGVLPVDEKPTLYVDGKSVDSVYDPVAGTLTPVNPMSEGEHDLSYTLTDIAGNESLPSDPIQVIVDTKAPTQPTAPTEYVDNVDPVQGTFASGTTTNDTTPSVIVGVLPVDEKPTLYVDGKPVDSVYDPVAGTLTPVNPIGEGDHDISYTLTDIAGNESLPSDPIQVIVDTKAPTQPTAPTEYVDNVDPVQGTFTSGTTTNDTTPSVIVGTLPVDEKPTLYVDGDKVDSVYDPVAGTLTPVVPLAEGDHDISYTLTDIAGNESLPSDPFQVIVDTKAPTQPTAPTEFVDNVGSKQGDFTTGTTTDDTTPSVIVGTLPADEKPTLYVDGKPVDSIYDPAAGTLTPVTPLAEGEHDLSYTLTDIAGNESLPSDPIQVIVDTKAPTQPTAPTEFVDNVGSKQGDFTTGTTTDDTTPSVIVGALPADEKPTLYVDGKPVDSVYDPVAGTLTPVNPMSEGDHAISYTLTDVAGNESAASDPILVKVDTTAPTALINIKTYADDVGPITGEFNKNTKTDDTAPVLNIKVNGTINTDEVVQIYRDGKYIGDATLVKGNNYQFADSGLVDGKTYNYTARVVDAAGNYGEFNGNFKITIDTTAPNQPNAPTAYIDNVDPVQGTFASGDITNDTTPSIIIGALNADEIPNLYVDGQKVDSIYDATTNTLTPVNPLDEGTHHVSYSLSDETGNESAPSDPIVIIVDITPPDQPATPTEYIDDVGMFQGHLGTGTSTDDTTPSVIVGILPADEKPTLYVDGKAVDAIYDPVAGTLTPVLPLIEGDHALSYTLTDIAGNESLPSGAIKIQIDTTKPIIDDLSTSFKLAVDTADGVAVGYTSTITATNNDLITRDNTLGQISGVLNRSLVQGEMLQISKDGGLTWEDVTSIQGANWTYQDNDVHAVDATVEFSFRVRDDVGNYTYLAGQEKSVQIDLTGPNGISLKPNVASQIVSGVKYTFTSAEYGLAEPGTKIALVNDVNNNGMWQEGIDTVVSYATVDANGQWSITTNIPKGDQNLAFLVWDKAGNVSTLSPITHVTSDDKVTPPTTGGPGAEVIVTKWGGTTDGDGYGVNCAAVTVNADGTYSFWQSVRGTTNSTCTTTANAGRVYSGVDLENYSAAYLAQASKANGAGYNLDNCCYGQFVSSAVFADINRDGNADVMSQLSSYGNCGYTAYWMNNGDGTYSSKALNQGVLNHLGGVIAYDRTGDGYLDFVIADSCSDSITFIKNNAGNLTYETSTVTCSGNGMPQSAAMTIYNGLKTGSITGTAMPKDLSILHDVAGVDLDNNGTIDIVAHVDYNGKVLYGDCSRGMGIMYNSGTSAGFTYVNQANVFTSDGGTDYGNLQQSIVFADYNGDGWLDMFISRGTKAGVDSNESRIYLNDGKGQLNATDSQALWFGDKLSGGSAFAIDWNLDGKQDLIEVPAQVTGCYIKTGFAPTLYLNYGNNVWGKDAYALTPSTYTDITGATAVDYNWDGSVDLLLYRAGSDAGVVSSTNSAPTILIKNTNVAVDGTSLHVKILDGQGINSYYGNTVKLYDSKGNLVSTQVLNPQSSGSTDSTGIVNFYGLDPNETYSIQLLRISNGVADNVGGIDNLGGYANKTINSSWTGLIAGKANEAYVLLAESDTATNNSGSNASGVVGTGYNDHFYGSLGNDHYNGGGGWETGANGKQVWVANGGEDILDYSNLQGQISINVATGTVTKVINGIKTIDTFENIEQFVGAKGDTVFTGNDTNHVFVGGAGNDTFNLGSTASDTIYFNLLNPKDPTGGNGTDTVNGFHVGKVGTDQNADIIDIHELLDNYKGTAGLYTDVDSVKLDIASSGLKNYLQITDDGTNTYISVDLNGTGHNYATVLTLHDVKTDLETLLLNNQIVI